MEPNTPDPTAVQAPPALTLVIGDGAPRQLPANDAEAALRALYAPPASGSASVWVRSNMVASVDGAIRGAGGTSASINNETDHRVFRIIRSWAQVILVGAGTARAEGYTDVDLDPVMRKLRRERGWSPDPLLALITASGDIPLEVFAGSAQVWTTTAGAARLRRLCFDLPAGAPTPDIQIAELAAPVGGPASTDSPPAQVSLRAVVEALGTAGFRHVVLEGGPRVLAQALAEGVVDEMCLTRIPLIVGNDAPSLVPRPLPAPLVAHLRHLAVASDGTMVQRWTLPQS